MLLIEAWEAKTRTLGSFESSIEVMLCPGYYQLLDDCPRLQGIVHNVMNLFFRVNWCVNQHTGVKNSPHDEFMR
jgi:hypothetical protein